MRVARSIWLVLILLCCAPGLDQSLVAKSKKRGQINVNETGGARGTNGTTAHVGGCVWGRGGTGTRQVNLQLLANGEVRAETTTRLNSHFQFADVIPPGSYELQATGMGLMKTRETIQVSSEGAFVNAPMLQGMNDETHALHLGSINVNISPVDRALSAKVILHPGIGGACAVGARTDSGGNAKIQNVVPGSYELRVYSGSSSKNKRIEVHPDENMNVKILLAK